MTDRLALSALVNNHSGVLLRVAGLFARRGFNIQSLTVSQTENPEFKDNFQRTSIRKGSCSQ